MEKKNNLNWISQKVSTRSSSIEGRGTFARTDIAKGELIIAFGGTILSSDEWSKIPDELKKRSLAIYDHLELCPREMQEIGDGDYVNHSCEPNAGIKGQIFLVAMRNIMQGEEVTFDYAMVIADPTFHLPCHCCQPNCRRIVTGGDWENPELQKKYNGYFSYYIQEKIDALKK